MKSMKFNTSAKYKNNKFQIKYLKAKKMILFNRDAKRFLDIEIIKPIEDVYIEELTGIRSSAPVLIRDMNKTNEVKSVVDIDKYR